MLGILKKLLLILLFMSLSVNVVAGSASLVLKRGVANEEVWELQQRLDDLGYQIDVDGRYGLQTEIIVKAFQNSFGLKADGVAGEDTWNLLRQKNPLLTYVVKRGDTLIGLAKKFDTNRLAIELANNLKNDTIYEGQKLSIPRSWMGGGDEPQAISKIQYEVSSGDTLSGLAKKFETSIDVIKAENKLNSEKIIIGQRLVITNKANISSQGFKKGNLMWPVTGRITSPYGTRIHPIYKTTSFHNGLDIAASRGTPVRAAASGLVITSSWYGDYGRAVMIDHGDSYVTLYGHNDTLLVKPGAFVVAGQVIALSGSTGVSTGPHVHFEVRKNNKTLDPLGYLVAQ